MKTASTKKAALIAALIIGSTAWLHAQYNTPGQIAQTNDKSFRQDQKSANLTAVPMKANKASSLIGSAVKNQQGEKLGKIQDIVIDFNSDRVAYAVLATDAGVLQPEKLHAIPLRAFQFSADGTSVTLNADKDKLIASEGFDKNSWPSLNTSTWGAEPLWKGTEGTNNVNQQNRVNEGPLKPRSVDPQIQPQP